MGLGEIPLACGDHTFPLLEHSQAIELVSMLGFEGIDISIMGNRSQLRPERVRADVAGTAAAVKRMVAGAGLRIADIFVIPWTDFETLAPNHPDPTVRSASRVMFEDLLRFTVLAGAPGITIVPGIVFDELGAEGSMELAAEELQWRAELARDADRRFSVEPHIGSVVGTPALVLELLEKAPAVEVTLDYTHFIAQGIDEGEIHPLIETARHVHARGARSGRGQCPMRENVIAYEQIVERLLASDYDGFIAAEYVWIEWEHMNECDNVSETVILRDRLRAHLAGRDWEYVGSNT